MNHTFSKTKLTLWVAKDIKEFGKRWTKRHHESVSHLLSVYLHRLKEIEGKNTAEVTPIVKRISGVAKGGKAAKTNYKKHLEDKYLDA